MRLGLGTGLCVFRWNNAEPLVITVAEAGTDPALGPLTDGDQVQDALAASATQTGNYTSTEGTIASAVATVTVDASTESLTYVTSFGEQVSVSITVTDSEGNERVFSAGSQTVAALAPTAAGGIADQTFTEDTAITPLDVDADFSGTAPITYALAPSSAALPTGLSLSSAGEITGTPTVVASLVNIVVRGTNSAGFADTAFGVTVEEVPATETVATAGGAGEIIFDPIVPLQKWTAATGDPGEIVFTEVDSGATEVFYKLSTDTEYTRATGASPLTVSGLTEGADYDYLVGDGDGTTATVAAGESAFIDPSTVFFGSSENGFYIDATDDTTRFQNTAGTTPADTDQDTVQRIDDLSPNGNDFIQSDASLSPKYETDGTREWIKSDGTNDYMDLSSGVYASSSGYFVCFAGRIPSLADADPIFSMDNASAGDRGHQLLRQTGGAFSSLAFSTTSQVVSADSPAYTEGEWCVVTANLDGNTLTVTLNGVAGTPDTLTGTPRSTAQILRMFGERRTNTVSEMALTIGLVVDRPATAQEISDMQQLCASKVGITI